MTRPPAMDRRDVLRFGAAAAFACLAPPSIAFAARTSSTAGSRIVVADPRYAESVIFAENLERKGAKLAPIASDIGGTWFRAVAPRLPHGLQSLSGLTLESDLFIVERLAEGSGARTCYRGAHDWRCRPSLGHTLSGSIDLDPIASALSIGGDGWQEGLADALHMAKDEDLSERRVQLECTSPAGSGPRFFVSWLIRWTA